MRQILIMILHCLYIYILVYKFKRNLHYTCKLQKIFELLKRIHYSESIKVTQTDYVPRFRVKFKKKMVWYTCKKVVPWSMKSPSATCSHELPLWLFLTLSFWFSCFWFIFLVAFFWIFLSTDTFSCDRHKQRGWRSNQRQIVLIFEMCSRENRDLLDLNGMDCPYQCQPEWKRRF